MNEILPQNNWYQQLEPVFLSQKFSDLCLSLAHEYSDYIVYPSRENIFTALKLTDYNNVRVCILGQDPYHNKGQANGLAFAVNEGVTLPPSLKNIFKELYLDLGVPAAKNGTLTGWAKQGVLLLNTTLTVRQNAPKSHKHLGWSIVTNTAIQALNKKDTPIVFILWGNEAIAKEKLIAPHHHIIKSAHPCPLSARHGFFGSRPFSKTNKLLLENGFSPIDWSFINLN